MKILTNEKVEDTTKTFVVLKQQADVPYFNFAPLQNAMIKLQESADAYAKMFKILENHPTANTIRKINSMVYKSERYLTSEQGLPGRPWYKYLIYAPGFYTSYGVKTIHGVREAIEQREYKEVEPQIELLSKTLMDFSEFVDEMIKAVKE